MHDKKVFVNVNNAKGRESYRKELQEIADAGYDPFSFEKIMESGKQIIKKGNYWFAINNDHPYPGSKHHFLIIAMAYVESAIDLKKEAFAELQDFIKELSEAYQITGSGFWMRSGDTDATGATVTRLHAHLISKDLAGNGVRIPLG